MMLPCLKASHWHAFHDWAISVWVEQDTWIHDFALSLPFSDGVKIIIGFLFKVEKVILAIEKVVSLPLSPVVLSEFDHWQLDAKVIPAFAVRSLNSEHIFVYCVHLNMLVESKAKELIMITYFLYDFRSQNVTFMCQDDGVEPQIWRVILPEPLVVLGKVRFLRNPKSDHVIFSVKFDQANSTKTCYEKADQDGRPRSACNPQTMSGKWEEAHESTACDHALAIFGKSLSETDCTL